MFNRFHQQTDVEKIRGKIHLVNVLRADVRLRNQLAREFHRDRALVNPIEVLLPNGAVPRQEAQDVPLSAAQLQQA
jgi:hypothetical protein